MSPDGRIPAYSRAPPCSTKSIFPSPEVVELLGVGVAVSMVPGWNQGRASIVFMFDPAIAGSRRSATDDPQTNKPAKRRLSADRTVRMTNDIPKNNGTEETGQGDAVRHEKEEAFVSDATRLSARLIYEVIRRDGEEELRRPVPSLVWSGIAAGILISLSVLGESILRTHLNSDLPGSFLVENMGYTLGFIVVIFGRMQLFTENTLTTVLPVIARPDRAKIVAMVRLWTIVLAANVAGAFIAASFLGLTEVLGPDLRQSFTELSHHAVGFGAYEGFIRAIPAGVLIAAVVWMMPSAQGNAFFTVFAFTWLIAAGDFAHVVAGSVEMAFLLVRLELGIVPALLEFFLPVLAGNVVGGTAIFALMAWGQVRNEVEHGTGQNESS